MTDIVLKRCGLNPSEQQIVSAGFAQHSKKLGAPEYQKEDLSWLLYGDEKNLVGALTADLLWDWLYIDELWVDQSLRGAGYGRKLLEAAEAFCREEKLVGIWLWTQSWQAASFYERCGFEKFSEVPDFPRGYSRFGFRKTLPL